jgi:hypothetical protein
MHADWDDEPQASEWTDIVLEGLRSSELTRAVPIDVADFWRGYEGADVDDRTQFWLMLISAIAREESSFDPGCVYEEPPPLSQKSIGLMQLSLTDRTYGCDFPTEESIKEPRRNLLCAIKIIDGLISRDGRIGGDPAHRTAGAAAYWSTLRAPRPGKRDSRSYVISRTSSL